MKVAGFLLLLAGWFIVLVAVALLHTPSARTGFVLAGVGTEVLGLIVSARAQSAMPQEGD